MRLPAPAALGAILLLAACAPEEPPATRPAEDACGASDLQGLVGQPVADQDFAAFGASQRIMQDGSPMTMDYRADRVNVRYDEAMKITEITCG